MTAGIPAPLTPELGAAVIDGILLRRSLKTIAKEIGYSETTLQKWLQNNPLFAAAVRSARLEATHGFMDETIEIADNEKLDPQQARNMIQARWRMAETRNRPDYGPTVDVSVTQIGDLRGTMIEARKRLVLPACDLAQIAPMQDVEYAMVDAGSTTDSESVAPEPFVNPFD